MNSRNVSEKSMKIVSKEWMFSSFRCYPIFDKKNLLFLRFSFRLSFRTTKAKPKLSNLNGAEILPDAFWFFFTLVFPSDHLLLPEFIYTFLTKRFLHNLFCIFSKRFPLKSFYSESSTIYFTIFFCFSFFSLFMF